MVQTVEFEGKDYNFADDITQDEIKSYLRKEVEKQETSFSDVARATAQGVTFGFGDEIEGIYKSLTGEGSYQENVEEARKKLDEFRERDPVSAYAAEIGGNIPSMLLGGAAVKGVQALGKLPSLARTVLGGATGGAAYGAGTAEEGERVSGSLTGAALGGGISGAAGVALPAVGRAAKELIEKGVPLTPGQAMGGIPRVIESGLAAAPFMGRAIEKATQRASAKVNEVVVNSALKPIGAKIKKGLTGTEAIRAADEALDEAYTVATRDASLSYTKPVIQAMKNAPSKLSGVTKQTINDASEIVDSIIGRYVGKKKLSGSEIKELDSLLGQTSYQYLKPTGTVAEKNIGRAISEAQSAFRKEMVRQNPRNKKLLDAHAAFRQMQPIKKATNKALSDAGEFTPSQLLASMRQQTPSKTAAGIAPQQKMATEAAQIIGKAPTAAVARPLLEAAILGGLVTSPSSVLPAIIGSGVGSTLYSRPLLGATRGVLTGTGEALRQTSPFLSGLLAPSFSQE